MARFGKLGLLILLAALLLGVAIRFVLAPEREGGLRQSVSFRPLASGAAEPELPPSPESLPSREAVTGAPASAPSAAPERTPAVENAPLDAGHVIGRFVSEQRAPLAGVTVRWLADEKEATRSGADGTFDWSKTATKDQPMHVVLRATHEGYASVRLEAVVAPGKTASLGDILLERSGAVSGRVVDTARTGIARALVMSTGVDEVERDADQSSLWGPRHGGAAETRTDASGQFLLNGVRAGRVRIWAKADGTLYGYTQPIEVRAGQETFGVELVLMPFPDDRLIELSVVTPDDQPVPFASIEYNYRAAGSSGSGTTAADAQGHYRHVLAEKVPHDFQAGDPQGKLAAAFARGVAPGTRNLVMRLSQPRSMRVRVRDDRGPVTEYEVSSCEREKQWSHLSGPLQGPHTDGVALLPIPTVSFMVKVDARGYQLAVQGPYEPDTAIDAVEVVLARLPGVRGRIVSRGQGVSGARVALHEAVSPRQRVRINHYLARSQEYAIAQGTTDGEGRFDLTLRSDGAFYLRAEAAGFAPGEIGPLSLRAEEGASDLEIELGAGGVIAGHVLLPAGENPAGVILGLSRGDGFPRTLRADLDGAYRIEHLTPGPWLLERAAEEISPSSTISQSGDTDAPVEIPSVCVVREGQVTSFDLDLRRDQTVYLNGQLLLGGHAADQFRAELQDPDGSETRGSESPLDREGRFQLRAGKPGSWRIALHGPDTGGARLHVIDLLDLRAGENSWQADIATGAVEGRVANRSSPGQELNLYWRSAARVVYIEIKPGSDGRFTLPAVPAGECKIVRDQSREPVLQFSVEAGQTVQIEVP